MNAIDSGTIAAAEAPAASRAAPSMPSEPANPALVTVTAEARVASVISRYLPKRSPSTP